MMAFKTVTRMAERSLAGGNLRRAEGVMIGADSIIRLWANMPLGED